MIVCESGLRNPILQDSLNIVQQLRFTQATNGTLFMFLLT